jgi:catechol 2,3-dioxygenase-like lactoylglutathione lyase family enzyme
MTTWLPVTNLERSRKFYRDVLGMPMVFENKKNGKAEFGLGSPGMCLGVQAFDYLESVPTNGGATIRLFVPDLYEAVEELRGKGVIFVTDIRRDDEAIRFCDFIDPDGNTLQLAEEIGAAHCTPSVFEAGREKSDEVHV